MLCDMLTRVESGTHPRSAYDSLCQASGFQGNPDGLLACHDLRKYVDVQQCCTYDWVHTLLQDGPLTLELSLLVGKLVELDLGSARSIGDYIDTCGIVVPQRSGLSTRLSVLFRLWEDRGCKG